MADAGELGQGIFWHLSSSGTAAPLPLVPVALLENTPSKCPQVVTIVLVAATTAPNLQSSARSFAGTLPNSICTAIDAAQAGFATVVVDDACACVSQEQLAEREALQETVSSLVRQGRMAAEELRDAEAASWSCLGIQNGPRMNSQSEGKSSKKHVFLQSNWLFRLSRVSTSQKGSGDHWVIVSAASWSSSGGTLGLFWVPKIVPKAFPQNKTKHVYNVPQHLYPKAF